MLACAITGRQWCFAYEAFGLLGGHDIGRAQVDGIDDGDRLQVAGLDKHGRHLGPLPQAPRLHRIGVDTSFNGQLSGALMDTKPRGMDNLRLLHTNPLPIPHTCYSSAIVASRAGA
jgi:hypothetical protein